MKQKLQRVLPAGLEAARHHFEQWRATREAPSRIPERLWTIAVRVAGRFGVHRTARALRLDYAVLKKRQGESAEANGSSRDRVHPRFGELVAAGSGSASLRRRPMVSGSPSRSRMWIWKRTQRSPISGSYRQPAAKRVA